MQVVIARPRPGDPVFQRRRRLNRDAAAYWVLRFRGGRRLVDAAAPYAVFSIGGALGRISANATWMIPPASPSATPIRQAMV